MAKGGNQPDIYEASFSSVLNVVQTEVRKVKRNPGSREVYSFLS